MSGKHGRVFHFATGRSIHVWGTFSFKTVFGATLHENGVAYSGYGMTKVEAVRMMRVEYLLRTNPEFAATMKRLKPSL